MLPKFNRVKGLHPGAILKRAIRKEGLKSKALAQAIGEYPQTISAIINERRGMPAKLSIKLGNYFDTEHDYFMLLQAAYEVQQHLNKEKRNPFKGNIRKVLFWDTDIDQLDLTSNRRFIIQRILERGNKEEITELIQLYTKKVIRDELSHIKDSFHPQFKANVAHYIES